MERFKLISLFDLYGHMLTKKQQLIAIDYLYEDLSYQEIAYNLNISKTAVYDTIKRVEKLLSDFESQLKILELVNNLRTLNIQQVNVVIDNYLKGE